MTEEVTEEMSGDDMDDGNVMKSIMHRGIAVEFILLVLNLYLAVAFGLHGKKEKMMKCRSNRDMHRGLVYKSALAAVILPFLRYACTLAFIFEGLFSTGFNGCEWSADFAYVGLMLGLLPTYTFLWARQRAFYSHPSLSGKYGVCISLTSKFVFVPIIVQGLVSVVLATYTRDYELDIINHQCVLSDHVPHVDYREFLYAGVMVSSQVVLLLLFINPIVSHVKSQNKQFTVRRNANDDTDFKSTTESSSQHDVSTINVVNTVSQQSECGVSLSTNLPGHNTNELDGERVKGQDENTTKEIIMQVSNKVPIQTYKNQTMLGVDNPAADIPDSKHNKTSTKIADTLLRQSTLVTNFIRRATRGRDTVRRGGKVFRLMKRTLYLALTSVLSDISVLLISVIWSNEIPQSMLFVLYDISMFINVVTVTASFENWCKILRLPCTVPFKCLDTQA